MEQWSSNTQYNGQSGRDSVRIWEVVKGRWEMIKTALRQDFNMGQWTTYNIERVNLMEIVKFRGGEREDL